MKKSSATILGVAGALAVVGACFAGVVHHLGGKDNGIPKADAEVLHPKVPILPLLVNDSDTLHKTADDFVGYNGYDALARGEKDLWAMYANKIRPEMMKDIQSVEKDVQFDHINITKSQDILKDLTMLKDLLTVADKHHDQTGADALKYYHRVAEDIHYYLTGQGEEFGVSHVEGGVQTVLDFLHSYGIKTE